MENLENFLQQWEEKYVAQVRNMQLFDSSYSKTWSMEQKQHFARVFYHARGHFQDFVWYIGNHSIDKTTKDVILKNIAEELNGAARSHEQLYLDFAETVGVDIKEEFLDEKYYLPFVREFNTDHLRWLHEHDADERFAALAAYEKLDNIDYAYLLDLVESFGTNNVGQRFYKVHIAVEHFEPTLEKLVSIWEIAPEKVMDAFDFIGNHQLKLWSNLSKEMNNA